MILEDPIGRLPFLIFVIEDNDLLLFWKKSMLVTKWGDVDVKNY
jgi:hypothetical protein